MNKNPTIDSSRNSSRYVFLTGATGLVGRYLMRDLFLQGHKLVVVVRRNKRMNVQQRIESIMQRWELELGQCLPRPVIFEGDVTQPNLGLSPDQVLWVREHCDQLIHNAAVLQFNGASRTDEPWRTNLGGTKNVLGFSKLVEISQFHYVSTAYVCGKRENVILESEFDEGQDFRNDYERSKFESEQLVRSADHFESTTIYRPAVIVGDSETGYTSTYHGLFLYLRLLATLVPQQKRNEAGVIQTPIHLPINGDEPRNLVPVDWVASSICEIFNNPDAHGKTFHLSPDKCTTAREVIDFCYEYFNSCGVKFAGDEGAEECDNEFSKSYFENVSVYKSYETSDPTFDKSNVDQFVTARCPEISKEMTLRFLEFGSANRWGKKREKVPVVERWFDSELANIAESATDVLNKLNSGNNKPLVKFGLDIRGPGGGQWQFTGNDGEFSVALGLPPGSCPILVMDDQQVNELLKRSESANQADSVGLTGLWFDSIANVLSDAMVR